MSLTISVVAIAVVSRNKRRRPARIFAAVLLGIVLLGAALAFVGHSISTDRLEFALEEVADPAEREHERALGEAEAAQIFRFGAYTNALPALVALGLFAWSRRLPE